jgi:Tfp pilus assembly protein PilF
LNNPALNAAFEMLPGTSFTATCGSAQSSDLDPAGQQPARQEDRHPHRKQRRRPRFGLGRAKGERLMLGKFTGFRVCRLSWLWVAAALCCVAALALDPCKARAADMDTWRRCMQTVDPALSIRDCSKIVDSGAELPDNAAYAYLYRGEAYGFCREDALAADDFGKSLQLSPQLVHPHYGLGQIMLRGENYAGAEAEFSKAVASDGEDADIGPFTRESLGRFKALPLTQRGFARYKQGNIAQALADYTEAAKICPTCSTAARDIGFLLSSQRKFDEAAAQFDRAIAIDMRSPEDFWGRGVVMALSAKFAPAVADYSEAIRLDPKFAPAYRNRASADAKLGKAKEAANDTRQAAALEQAAAAARKSKCERVDPTDDGSSGEDDGERVGLRHLPMARQG